MLKCVGMKNKRKYAGEGMSNVVQCDILLETNSIIQNYAVSFQKVCSQASKAVKAVQISSRLRPNLWFVTFLPPLTVGWLIRTNKIQLWLIFLLQFYIYDIGSGKSISRVKGLSDVCCSVVYHPLYAQVCYLRNISPSTITRETAKSRYCSYKPRSYSNSLYKPNLSQLR